MATQNDDRSCWPMIPRWQPVPPQFHSLELEGPFTACMLCDADLSDEHRTYFIERIFRGSEPIVEYAMCLDCQQSMCSELSEESQENIELFFARVDHDRRIDRLRAHVADDGIHAWLDECLITGKKRSECRGYQIIGMCQGMDLQVGAVPFMLSDNAVEQAMEVISKKTRDRLSDFISDNFGMPPEFCELPDFFPALI